MSDNEMHPQEAPAPLLSASPDTAGAMLRAARERAGLHVAALAVAIKIPVKKLEALESDQLHNSHDLVFTRALASSVCRALKIDAKPILDALPQNVVRELHVDDNGINAPFAASPSAQSRSLKDAVTQPWAILVIALCVGAFVILASGWFGQKESAPVAANAVADEVVAPVVAAPVVIPAAPAAEMKGEPVTVAATLAPSSNSPATTAVAPATGSTASAPAEAASRPATGAVAVPGSELIMAFRAKHQSVWVEVVDAKGDIRLRRNVSPGERVECGGVLPLSVVLGRADSVDVEVRGKPFNFSAYAKDNVARFEVK